MLLNYLNNFIYVFSYNSFKRIFIFRWHKKDKFVGHILANYISPMEYNAAALC